MKQIGIATDSHSGILPARAKDLGVMVLPMPFFFDEECFYEEVSITREDLKKGGRITATTAALGTLLNIKPVLRLGVGVLDTYRKCRGMKKAKAEMLATMKQEMETTYQDAIEQGEFYLMAATSADEETTKAWVEEIKAYFPGMEVMCNYLTMGISCHTGEGALGIGCSCKPKKNK